MCVCVCVGRSWNKVDALLPLPHHCRSIKEHGLRTFHAAGIALYSDISVFVCLFCFALGQKLLPPHPDRNRKKSDSFVCVCYSTQSIFDVNTQRTVHRVSPFYVKYVRVCLCRRTSAFPFYFKGGGGISWGLFWFILIIT